MSGTVPATPRGTLFGLKGRQLTGLGIVLGLAGVGLFVGSTALMFSAFGNFPSDPFGSFGAITGAMALFSVLSILGMILIGLGAFALRFGLIHPVASYVATEASPAITTAATALGRGLQQGMGGAPIGGAATVKVRCRNCGYLDSEDAKYCSKCAQAL
jgi:hypothetical protein